MTELFITDIDGCLLDPMQIPDWDILTEIRSLNEQSKHDSAIPSLTLCTGRPLDYAEAVAQIMGINHPFIFENAGIFDPTNYKIHLNGALSNENRKTIEDLKDWLKQTIMSEYDGFSLEFSKIMDAGIVHPDEAMIQQVLPTIQKHVAKNYPDIEVHVTNVSVNIIFKKNNKETGIQKLCKWNDISTSEAAFIGDSTGDIPGLKVVGRSFAPNNARKGVKEVSNVLPYRSTQAVLEAYKKVIAQNRT